MKRDLRHPLPIRSQEAVAANNTSSSSIFSVLWLLAFLVAPLFAAGVALADGGGGNVASKSRTCVLEQSRTARPERAIGKLPEFRKTATGLPPERHMVVGSGPMLSVLSIGASCFVSVPVYVDHGDRLELWHVFLLDTQGRVSHIQDLDGNYVTLKRWRAAPAKQ